MKILILTSSLNGTASHHLDYLINNSQIEVKMVVFNKGKEQHKKKQLFKTIKKTIKIGLSGALNGIRIRKWYTTDLDKYIKIENLEKKCKRLNIPFFSTQTINCSETIDLIKSANVDIGISLGNSYISKKVFNIPHYGMINIHHEILPKYQNAQSIIWQVYNGSSETGYTIHKIVSQIDTGEIIFQEAMPIKFRKSLADTVTFNYSSLLKGSAFGLVKVLENFDEYFSKSTPQGKGIRYTTPTFGQYLKILKQYKLLCKLF